MQLSHQHCLNHSLREAVARCPECRQFFCRECITEHDDRVICASCLKKTTFSASEKSGRWVGLERAGAAIGGVILAWIFFYWAGQSLISIPSEMHEGTLWKTGFWEEGDGAER